MYIIYSLLVVSLGIAVQIKESASSCQVYPSEYAYREGSVYKTERTNANCRNYPSGHELVRKEDYIHCDGALLRLTDSYIGSDQYTISDYYVWLGNDTKNHQLLFTFPTRVNLIMIILHYYRTSGRGLPKLRFYAVPDDFDIWGAPTTSNIIADVAAVPPDRNSLGQENVTIVLGTSINTKKILMVKFKSSFAFVVSEVEFYNSCSTIQSSTSAEQDSTTDYLMSTSYGIKTTSTVDSEITSRTLMVISTENKIATKSNSSNKVITIAPEETEDKNSLPVWIAVGVVITTLIVLMGIATTALALFLKKSSQHKSECDNSYSTLSRGPTQQLQPQSLHPASDLYDHIQLSPSTGQAEFISNTENDNTNNPLPHQCQQNINLSVEMQQPKSASVQITAACSKTIQSYENEITVEQPTYAVINKTKKRKNEKEPVHCPPKSSAATSLTLTKQNSTDKNIESHPVENAAKENKPKCNQNIQEIATQIPSQTSGSAEELYTAVRKRTKESTAQDEEEPSPIPPQGVEQLYTAVNKKTQPTTANDEVESPPITSHTVEELYTAVMKKPKARETDDEVEAPPVPPHTMEELYTSVQKNKI